MNLSHEDVIVMLFYKVKLIMISDQVGFDRVKASMPVIARPNIKAWMSFVPS